MKSVTFKLASPLPNIIMLGDFNLPTMSWSQPGDCFISRVFCPFVESLFLQQYVNLPTRKNNILDLVFCNSDLIDGIDICDTCISDHCLLTVNTSVPVCFSKYHIIVNPPSSIFEMLNFKRCNWLTLQCALRDIDWGALFSLVLNEDYFNFSIPLSNKVVTDPVSFFAISNACYKKSEVLLTSINFSEQMIIDAISEISASSAPGPDGIQASFWKKMCY